MSNSKNPARWWLKVDKAFLDSPQIKRLTMLKGDAALGLYIRIVIESLPTDCWIETTMEGVTIEEEIALRINSTDLPTITDLLGTLEKIGLVHTSEDKQKIYFQQADEMSDNETKAASRMRAKRERDNELRTMLSDSVTMLQESEQCSVTRTESERETDQNKINSESNIDFCFETVGAEACEGSTGKEGTATPFLPGLAGCWAEGGDLKATYERYWTMVQENNLNITQDELVEFAKETKGFKKLWGKDITNPLRALRAWIKTRVPQEAEAVKKELTDEEKAEQVNAVIETLPSKMREWIKVQETYGDGEVDVARLYPCLEGLRGFSQYNDKRFNAGCERFEECFYKWEGRFTDYVDKQLSKYIRDHDPFNNPTREVAYYKYAYKLLEKEGISLMVDVSESIYEFITSGNECAFGFIYVLDNPLRED